MEFWQSGLMRQPRKLLSFGCASSNLVSTLSHTYDANTDFISRQTSHKIGFFWAYLFFFFCIFRFSCEQVSSDNCTGRLTMIIIER